MAITDGFKTTLNPDNRSRYPELETVYTIDVSGTAMHTFVLNIPHSDISNIEVAYRQGVRTLLNSALMGADISHSWTDLGDDKTEVVVYLTEGQTRVFGRYESTALDTFAQLSIFTVSGGIMFSELYPVWVSQPIVYTSGGESIELQQKTVAPTTEEQEITPDEGYDGLESVTVEAVTYDIDENIISGNIRRDVNILGVIGSLESTIPQEGGGGAAAIWELEPPENIFSSYVFEPEVGGIFALGKMILDEVVDASSFSGRAVQIEFTSLDVETMRVTEPPEAEGQAIMFVIPSGEDFLMLSPDWVGILLLFIIPNASNIELGDPLAVFEGDLQLTHEEGKTTIGIFSALIPISENAVIPETEIELAALPYLKIAKFSIVEMTAAEALNQFIYSTGAIDIIIPATQGSVPKLAFAGKQIKTLVTEEREEDLSLEERAFQEAEIHTTISDPIILQNLGYVYGEAFKTGTYYSSSDKTVYSREIQLPQPQLRSIWQSSFEGCGTLRMTIPNTVTQLYDKAFKSFGGNQETRYMADKIECSQEYSTEIQSKLLTMYHCECSPLTTILRHSGATGGLATYTGAVIPQTTIDLFDELSLLYQHFITGCNITTEPTIIEVPASWLHQQFLDFKAVQDKIIELGEVSRWELRELYYSPRRLVIVGLNRPFIARTEHADYDGLTRDNFIEILATAFGYDDITTFLNYAQNLADEYISNTAGADSNTIQNRLKYDGAIYTSNGSFILPYSLSGAGCFYIILSDDGVLSAVFNSFDTNFLNGLNVVDGVYNTYYQDSHQPRKLYGRCLIFDERYNRPENERPHLSVEEGTNITNISGTPFSYSGIDSTVSGKLQLQYIPGNFFLGCKKLKKFKTSNSDCSGIGEGAFKNSGIEEYEQPEGSSGLSSISTEAFWNSKLQRIKDVYLGNDKVVVRVNAIYSGAFFNCTDFPKNESGEVVPLELINTYQIGTDSFRNTAIQKLIFNYDEVTYNHEHPTVAQLYSAFGLSIDNEKYSKDVDIEILNAGTNYYNGLAGVEGAEFNSIKIKYYGAQGTINIGMLIVGTLDLDFGTEDVSTVNILLLNSAAIPTQIEIGTLVLRSTTMINVLPLAGTVDSSRRITQVLVPGALLENYRAQTQSLTFNPIV